MADATRAGGVQRGIQRPIVGGEIEAIEVAVGIDQHENTLREMTKRPCGRFVVAACKACKFYMVWVGRSDFSAPAR
ncbi:hypothetical protein F1C79_13420 [Pseudomonas denitrificans (nom. rej.)]|uniref:Uncharacterized protein n=1 Tax=Pseudomonas denitrificans TaxID=43306 RepID=A0A9X7N6D5_PSEDE|nr:hypothetical protein F1C79_13420 [Pseudomonas denitrificans (nom. rej.)]